MQKVSKLVSKSIYIRRLKARVTTVLKIMDAGYCLYVHIFMKNIKSLKPFNFNNSNQLMPDLRFQQSRLIIKYNIMHFPVLIKTVLKLVYIICENHIIR